MGACARGLVGACVRVRVFESTRVGIWDNHKSAMIVIIQRRSIVEIMVNYQSNYTSVNDTTISAILNLLRRREDQG